MGAGQAGQPPFDGDEESQAIPGSHSGLIQVGRVLRQAREAKGLSLEQLANQLRMGNEQLAALEIGDRANLPETVFIKAMVRRVASKLGIDADPLVRGLQSLELEGEMGPTSSQSSTSLPTRTLQGPRSTAPQRNRAGLALLSALAAIAAAGAAALNVERLAPALQRWTTASQPEPSPSPPQTQAQTTVAETTAAARPGTLPTSVTVSSSEPSWVVIRNDAGTVLFEGTLTASKTLKADSGLEIYAGRPDLVKVSHDGQEPPTESLGPIDQVRWYRITAAPSRPAQAL